MSKYRVDDTGTLIQHKTPRRVREERYDALIRKRTLIRKAFDCVRYSPEDAAVKQILLQALTGKREITESVLETARQVLA